MLTVGRRLCTETFTAATVAAPTSVIAEADEADNSIVSMASVKTLVDSKAVKRPAMTRFANIADLAAMSLFNTDASHD